MHLIQRGNNRQACFFTAEDYRSYLRWLAEGAEQFGCRVHAWVLMTNHVHLLVSADAQDAVAQLMKCVGQRYTQYVNRVYGRTGSLWEGRFRSCLTDSDAYVLTCMRYIELNPVRAGMVDHPGDYGRAIARMHTARRVCSCRRTPRILHWRLTKRRQRWPTDACLRDFCRLNW
jgi:putative transposase